MNVNNLCAFYRHGLVVMVFLCLMCETCVIWRKTWAYVAEACDFETVRFQKFYVKFRVWCGF